MATMTTAFIETESRPHFITRIRRLSKSNFTFESECKSPRLDKMIAHVNLFDRTTKYLEDELAQQRADTLAEKRITKPIKVKVTRPGMGRRESSATTEISSDEQIPQWVTEMTSRAVHDCIVVTEVEHIEGSLSP